MTKNKSIVFIETVDIPANYGGFDDTHEKLARSVKAGAYMQQRWGKMLSNDSVFCFSASAR